MHTFEHKRLPNWDVNLTHFMVKSQMRASTLKLDWANTTCTSWVGEAIEVITGYNPYESFKGRHKSIASACRAIKEAGFTTLDDLIASMFVEIPVAFAQRGDLILAAAARSARGISEAYTEQHGEFEETEGAQVMPNAVGLADPPRYWAIGPEGLVFGDLYTGVARAFAVGRDI